MVILLSDDRARVVPLWDESDPLVSLTFAPAALVRTGLAERLNESLGGQYWPSVTGVDHAIYGPVEGGVVVG